MKLIIDIPENVIEGAKLSSNYYPTYYFEIWRAVANGTPYEERPQGESIRIEDGMKKARSGNYVIYDVDFLLDNLAREVNIMESTRQWKAGKGNDND